MAAGVGLANNGSGRGQSDAESCSGDLRKSRSAVLTSPANALHTIRQRQRRDGNGKHIYPPAPDNAPAHKAKHERWRVTRSELRLSVPGKVKPVTMSPVRYMAIIYQAAPFSAGPSLDETGMIPACVGKVAPGDR
jgi:hypothetical protein